MHTFTGEKGTIIHYNGDYSGDVIIVKRTQGEDSSKVRIPCQDIFEFVAESIRDKKEALLEHEGWRTLLIKASEL